MNPTKFCQISRKLQLLGLKCMFVRNACYLLRVGYLERLWDLSRCIFLSFSCIRYFWDNLLKNGCSSASFRDILWLGSYSSIRTIKSNNKRCSSSSLMIYLWIGLQFSRTYRPADDFSSQSSLPWWKYFVLKK